jgi:hypothetical protein
MQNGTGNDRHSNHLPELQIPAIHCHTLKSTETLNVWFFILREVWTSINTVCILRLILNNLFLSFFTRYLMTYIDNIVAKCKPSMHVLVFNGCSAIPDVLSLVMSTHQKVLMWTCWKLLHQPSFFSLQSSWEIVASAFLPLSSIVMGGVNVNASQSRGIQFAHYVSPFDRFVLTIVKWIFTIQYKSVKWIWSVIYTLSWSQPNPLLKSQSKLK